jgi:hypothetical protein
MASIKLIVQHCVLLSANIDTESDLVNCIKTALPKENKNEQMSWLRQHIKAKFEKALIKNFPAHQIMAASYLKNKWKRMLCRIFPDRALMDKVSNIKKSLRMK